MNSLNILFLIFIICIIFFFILYKLFLFYTTNFHFESFISSSTSNKTIILLGDSILNNTNYVSSNTNIPYLLHSYLTKQNNQLLNLAQDNASISTVYNQLNKIPIDLNNSNTFIILSVGGNDLLNGYQDINQIIIKYKKLLNSIQSRLPRIHLILINLYYPFGIDQYYSLIEKWNNNLKNYTFKQIDLTKIMNNSEDFINIEPSSMGGQKIIQQIINKI